MIERLIAKVQDADLILVGVGTDFQEKHSKEETVKAYNNLQKLIGQKPYFIVTLNTDDLIYESELDSGRIVAPCGSEAAGNVVQNEDYDESIYLSQWQVYMKWLQNTLNRKLCVLELGVGFQFPSVIRWPFEKTVYFNQKSIMVRVHGRLAQLTEEIKERGIAIDRNPVEVLLSISEIVTGLYSA